MSKIASKPIELVSDVRFNLNNNRILVEGPRGKLELQKPDGVDVEQTDNMLKLVPNQSLQQ